MSRILIVEDESVIAADIARALRTLGHEPLRAVATGDEALRAVALQHPDLVLMDVQIRGPRDGIDTAVALRASCRIPIVFMTSHSDEATLARATAVSPQGYVLKPFDDRELHVAIEIALAKHELEQALAERERWFATTLQSIADAVIAADCDGNVTLINRGAAALLGCDAAGVLGQPLSAVFVLVDGSEPPRPLPGDRIDAASNSAPIGARLVCAQGRLVEVEASAAPIVSQDGRLLGRVIAFRDIRARLQLQQRIAQSERLATVGTLSSGVAHEINNPLMVVTASLDLIRTVLARRGSEPDAQTVLEPADRSRIDGLVDEAYAAALRVVGIVRELRQVHPTRERQRERVALPALVRELIARRDVSLAAAATLTLELEDTPAVLAEPARLSEAMAQLLINAEQAVADGGSVTVRTFTDLDGWAVVEVRDDGPGIAAHDLPRVFEPYFTTRAVGQGRGLGLSLAHGIVQAHGGSVTVESTTGAGATFRLRLPPIAVVPRAANG